MKTILFNSLLVVMIAVGHAHHANGHGGVGNSPCCACPQFWTFYEGNCYRFFGERITWSEAEDWCGDFYTTSGRAHLVSIHSEDENSFVYEMFRSSTWDTPDWQYVANARPLPFYGIWTGLHQEETDGAWVYTDGSAFDFAKWRPGEPNNNYYNIHPEDCVHVWRVNDASDVTQDWNDVYCDEVNSFVCKMSSQ